MMNSIRFGATYHIRLDNDTAGRMREQLKPRYNEDGYWRFYDPERVTQVFIESFSPEEREHQDFVPDLPLDHVTARVAMDDKEDRLTIITRQPTHERDTDYILIKALFTRLGELVGFSKEEIQQAMKRFPLEDQRDPARLIAGVLPDLPDHLLDNPNQVDPAYGKGTRPVLSEAIELKDRETIAKLLAHPAIDVNYAVQAGPLYTASRTGDIETVKNLLDFPELDPNAGGYNGWTPFTVACQGGYTDIARLLLQHPRLQPKAGKHFGTMVQNVRNQWATPSMMDIHLLLDRHGLL